MTPPAIARLAPHWIPTMTSSLLRIRTLPWLMLACTALLCGCASEPLRQYAYNSYQARPAMNDAWIQRWQADSDADYSSSQIVPFVGRSGGTEFVHPTRISRDATVSSTGVPVIQAWMEFKAGAGPIPWYRYVMLPLKNVSMSEVLAQGGYLARGLGFGLPAPMPERLTDGAIVTPWTYCHQCFTAQPVDALTPQQVAAMKLTVQRYTARNQRAVMGMHEGIRLIDSPRQAFNDLARPDAQALTGDSARQQEARLARRMLTLSGELSTAATKQAEYQAFIRDEIQPKTFAAWLTRRECPTPVDHRRRININDPEHDRAALASAVMRSNPAYIECAMQALKSYNLAAYAQAYPELARQADDLWQQSLKQDWRSVPAPDRMMRLARQDIDHALEGLRWAERYAESAQARAEQRREQAAISAAFWAGTYANIQQRNQQILAQNRQVLSNIRDLSVAPPAAPATPGSAVPRKPASHTSDLGGRSTTVARVPVERPRTEPEPAQTTDEVTSNRFRDASRDHRMTGANEAYLPHDTALDIARTQLRNQAAAFCGTSFKAHITWSSDPRCTQSARSSDYLCEQDALVNCYEQRCDVAFCGTKNP